MTGPVFTPAWYCRCEPPTNAQPRDAARCDVCDTIRPPSLDPLPDEWRLRFEGIVAWLDAELAHRPTYLQSLVGAGMMQLLSWARKDPDATYRTLQGAARALGAVAGWTEQGTVPADDAFDALGPRER